MKAYTAGKTMMGNSSATSNKQDTKNRIDSYLAIISVMIFMGIAAMVLTAIIAPELLVS